jgi:hypothetical protein
MKTRRLFAFAYGVIIGLRAASKRRGRWHCTIESGLVPKMYLLRDPPPNRVQFGT